jgi:hypothetical protein
MRAGLLADIILGESPHLKGLVKHFNLLFLNTDGRIMGFNFQFIKNSGKAEYQIIHQIFTKLFDSEEGKAELSFAVQQANKGIPGSVNFYFPGTHVIFKGVILPVYDSSPIPSNLMVISKETISKEFEVQKQDNFWDVATEMMEELGIVSSDKVQFEKTKLPKVLLIEDKEGIVVEIFRELVRKSKENFVLAPNTDAAQLVAPTFKPNVVLTTKKPKGDLDIMALSDTFETNFDTTTIFISLIDGELRIEVGWLALHVKNNSDAISRILDLIHQIYW